jgi:hypothetical protein
MMSLVLRDVNIHLRSFLFGFVTMTTRYFYRLVVKGPLNWYTGIAPGVGGNKQTKNVISIFQNGLFSCFFVFSPFTSAKGISLLVFLLLLLASPIHELELVQLLYELFLMELTWCWRAS